MSDNSRSYKVLLRKNETGEERWYTYDYLWDEHSYYLWTEGNYGCDCNRHLFFERAAGNDPDLDDGKCGEEVYTAICAVLPDGERRELDEPIKETST